MTGRRRADATLDQWHDDIQAGDYWKLVDDTGEPVRSSDPQNLTGTCWIVVAPKPGSTTGYMVGRLIHHTVREHEDGTISVRRDDGSSNSIKITRAAGEEWHGYIEHGVWTPC